jgi:hypothetical protein
MFGKLWKTTSKGKKCSIVAHCSQWAIVETFALINGNNLEGKTMINRKESFKQHQKLRGTRYAIGRFVQLEWIGRRVWLEHKSWKLVLVLCALEIVEFVQWLS